MRKKTYFPVIFWKKVSLDVNRWEKKVIFDANSMKSNKLGLVIYLIFLVLQLFRYSDMLNP